MTTNTALLITLAKPVPEEAETFHGYVEGSTRLALDAGAVVSSRIGVDHLHGDAPAIVFGLATFPDIDAITDMFASGAYQDLIPARDKSIESVNAYAVADTPITELPEDDGVLLITVAAPNPDAMDDLAAYQQVAGPVSARHGGQPLVQLPVAAHPVGSTPAAFVGVTAFPSHDAVEAFFADPEYVEAIPLRERALSSLELYVSAEG